MYFVKSEEALNGFLDGNLQTVFQIPAGQKLDYLQLDIDQSGSIESQILVYLRGEWQIQGEEPDQNLVLIAVFQSKFGSGQTFYFPATAFGTAHIQLKSVQINGSGDLVSAELDGSGFVAQLTVHTN